MIELIKSSTLLCLGLAMGFILLTIGVGNVLELLVKFFIERRGRICPQCNGAKFICWDNKLKEMLEVDVPCPKCNGVGRTH